MGYSDLVINGFSKLHFWLAPGATQRRYMEKVTSTPEVPPPTFVFAQKFIIIAIIMYLKANKEVVGETSTVPVTFSIYLLKDPMSILFRLLMLTYFLFLQASNSSWFKQILISNVGHVECSCSVLLQGNWPERPSIFLEYQSPQASLRHLLQFSWLSHHFSFMLTSSVFWCCLPMSLTPIFARLYPRAATSTVNPRHQGPCWRRGTPNAEHKCLI